MGFYAPSENDATVGSTAVTRATANTTWTAYPSTATTNISRFQVEVDVDNAAGRRIWVALDNAGTNYTSLAPGDMLEIQPNGIKQIYIRTATLTATFSMWYDLEI